MANEKVTIITKGGMGNIVITHARLIEHGRKPYAQYKSAPFVRFIKKGARKETGIIQGYAPYIVILAGWVDMQSQELFGAAQDTGKGYSVAQGKFSTFDEGWAKEFEAQNALTDIIADYRGVNTYEAL